jgi:hypothetical protein
MTTHLIGITQKVSTLDQVVNAAWPEITANFNSQTNSSDGDTHTCSLCSINLTRDQLAQHLEFCRGVGLCPSGCGEKFENRGDLRTHLQRGLCSKTAFTCDCCEVKPLVIQNCSFICDKQVKEGIKKYNRERETLRKACKMLNEKVFELETDLKYYKSHYENKAAALQSNDQDLF